MKSLTGKILLILVIVFNMGTLLHFPYVYAESFSFTKDDNSNTGGGVPGPSPLTPISSNTGGGVPGPSGPNNASSNTGGGVPGPSGPNNANEALNDVYKTIIKQQQEHIQFLMNQQQALKDLLVNKSSLST